jgi:hypothetical protein
MVDLPVLQGGKAEANRVERLDGCVEKRASTLPDDSVACRPRGLGQCDLAENKPQMKAGRAN